jgi:hypothetical protein
MAQRRAEFPEPATRDHRSEGVKRAYFVEKVAVISGDGSLSA